MGTKQICRACGTECPECAQRHTDRLKIDTSSRQVDCMVSRQEYLRVVKQLRIVEAHRDILGEALSEIKAITEGSEVQTIEDVLQGCVSEVNKLLERGEIAPYVLAC